MGGGKEAGQTLFRRVRCSDGVEIAVHHLGGQGPNLVVLAATGFLARSYSELVAGLLQNFTCIGIDLRGHGDSTSGPGTDLLYHGTDVATVVRTLELQGSHAFGHCIGGMAAIWAEILQPGSFCQIITYEPILYHYELTHALGDDHIQWTAPALLQRLVAKRQQYFSSRAEAQAKLKEKPPWNRFSQGSLEAYIEHGFKDTPVGIELKCTPANEALNMCWPRHLDPMHWVYPRLSEVQCPVSIMAGDNISDVNPTEFIALYIDQVAKDFPHASFERLEGLHHLGPFEDPSRVAKHILLHADMLLASSSSRPLAATSRLQSKL